MSISKPPLIVWHGLGFSEWLQENRNGLTVAFECLCWHPEMWPAPGEDGTREVIDVGIRKGAYSK